MIVVFLLLIVVVGSLLARRANFRAGEEARLRAAADREIAEARRLQNPICQHCGELIFNSEGGAREPFLRQKGERLGENWYRINYVHHRCERVAGYPNHQPGNDQPSGR